jgi:hypothetical protein
MTRMMSGGNRTRVAFQSSSARGKRRADAWYSSAQTFFEARAMRGYTGVLRCCPSSSRAPSKRAAAAVRVWTPSFA